MIRRSVFALFLVFFSALLMGCGPPWQVVKQATPDPLLGKKSFALLPVNFTGLKVGDKDEAGYLAEKDQETREKWAGDKEGINAEFAKNVQQGATEAGITVTPTTTPAGAEFILRPVVAWLEPGFFIGIARKSSRVNMTLQIITPDGGVVDEIIVTHGTDGSLFNAASGTRLRQDGTDLGHYVAKYLVFRTSGAK